MITLYILTLLLSLLFHHVKEQLKLIHKKEELN